MLYTIVVEQVDIILRIQKLMTTIGLVHNPTSSTSYLWFEPRRIISIIIIAILICFFPIRVYATTPKHTDKIIVSNIPLAGIVEMITGDIFLIDSINTQNTCPHDYHAKPSDLWKLQNAKIAIYIDDSFESFFRDLLKKCDSEVLKVTDMVDVISQDFGHHNDHRYTSVSEGHTDAHEDCLHQLESNVDHSHHDISDYHIWLDLDLVAKLLSKIRDYFVGNYPQFKELFDNNYQVSVEKLKALQEQKSSIFAKLPKLIVLNNNANSFFNHSNTIKNGVIFIDIDDYPSLKMINNLESYISTKDDICIITENISGTFGSDSAKLNSLQKKYNKNVVALNTEKWPLQPNDTYSGNFFKQYQTLIGQLSKCVLNKSAK